MAVVGWRRTLAAVRRRVKPSPVQSSQGQCSQVKPNSAFDVARGRSVTFLLRRPLKDRLSRSLSANSFALFLSPSFSFLRSVRGGFTGVWPYDVSLVYACLSPSPSPVQSVLFRRRSSARFPRSRLCLPPSHFLGGRVDWLADDLKTTHVGNECAKLRKEAGKVCKLNTEKIDNMIVVLHGARIHHMKKLRCKQRPAWSGARCRSVCRTWRGK